MLDNALDLGIVEKEFWEMTIAELNRIAESRDRVEKYRAKERATFDYILAGLIGRAFASSMDSKNQFPLIEEVYSSLFVDEAQATEEAKEQARAELSALRFKQFALTHNAKFKGV